MKISEIITAESMLSNNGPVSYTELVEQYGTTAVTKFLEAQLFAEARGVTLKESTDPETVETLRSLQSEDPEQGRIYYGLHLAAMGDTIQAFGSFRGKLISKKHTSTSSVAATPGMVKGDLDAIEYVIEFADGVQKSYPQILSNNVHMRVLFFSDREDFQTVKAELKLSHDVDFDRLMETSAGGIAGVAMPMGGMVKRQPPVAGTKKQRKKKVSEKDLDEGNRAQLGIPANATKAELEKIRSKGGKSGQRAHWLLNMRKGNKKR